MSTAPKILIIGANGQIGTELAEALVARQGAHTVVTSDLSPRGRVAGVVHEALDVPVKFIGVGEQADDLQPFDAKQFAEALFSE